MARDAHSCGTKGGAAASPFVLRGAPVRAMSAAAAGLRSGGGAARPSGPPPGAARRAPFKGPLVGIVDSGGPEAEMLTAAAFDHEGAPMPVRSDRLGHGSAVSAVIARACPGMVPRHAQVFGARPVTSALRVAAAVDWLRAEGAAVICLSLGLGADRAPLARACAAAREAGALLVAAHPATGGTCYPAAYPGVIGASGDARCAWADLSHLTHLGPAVFGGWCGSPERGGRGMGGASLGAARIAGELARMVRDLGHVPDAEDACARLSAVAAFHGPERRRAAGAGG